MKKEKLPVLDKFTARRRRLQAICYADVRNERWSRLARWSIWRRPFSRVYMQATAVFSAMNGHYWRRVGVGVGRAGQM